MKIVLYVLYFDEDSHQKAVHDFQAIPYARYLYIESTKYLENIVFQKTLPSLYAEWATADFVGIVSYRALDKGITIQKLRRIESIDPSQYDVVALHPMHRGTHMYRQAVDSHRETFMQIWTAILTKMGFEQELITRDSVVPFYCNYWFAKPKWLKQYCRFQTQIKDIMETDHRIAQLLQKDPNYKGGIPPERVRQIFDKDHYTYHPFILERMCCFYFQTHAKANIAYMWG